MKIITIILLMITTSIFAQKKVQNYRYVIVPNRFEFLKKEDQYQTNSLTKFLFNKYGFTAFLADEILPTDLVNNRCLALTATIKNKSSLFTIKTTIELRDCFNKVVFTSSEGKSRIKDYKKAYHEAIRNSFKSIKALKYNYTPIVNNKVDYQNKIVPEKIVNNSIIDNKISVINLYAQSTKNGFQLVDTNPKVVFKLLKTNVKNVFILEDKNGIIYKNNDIWIAEYYENGIKITEKYQVKF
ncbi:hypothetical protein [Tenacibaculum salmonis]|uniref:hypothetical protein n=1 Tax=Tenacibaculum sp. P3-BQ1 TaxID=3232310 RepID=UPI0034E001FD